MGNCYTLNSLLSASPLSARQTAGTEGVRGGGGDHSRDGDHDDVDEGEDDDAAEGILTVEKEIRERNQLIYQGQRFPTYGARTTSAHFSAKVVRSIMLFCQVVEEGRGTLDL